MQIRQRSFSGDLSLRAQRIRQARARFFEQGLSLETQLPAVLVDSWHRCQRHRLAPQQQSIESRVCSGARFSEALEKEADLMHHAAGPMAQFYEYIRGSGSMLFLSDRHGMILQSLGDEDFLTLAQKILLKPGALWGEQHSGTNAIGTAIAARQPVDIWGGEHYLHINGILTCSAAPIFTPQGELLGVIDISGARAHYHPHTLALVKMAAQMIERRYFLSLYGRCIVLAVHRQVHLLGESSEGLIAFEDDGTIIGAHAHALALTGDPQKRHHWQELTSLTFGHFIKRMREEPGHINVLTDENGVDWFFQWRSAPKIAFFASSWAKALPRPATLAQELAPNHHRLRDLEGDIIRQKLQENAGNVSQTARQLGISRNKIYRHMEKPTTPNH